MREDLYIRVIQLRKNYGWLQADLAKKSAISPSTVSQIESGGRIPSIPILKKLVKTLNTSIDYLVGIEQNNKSEAEQFYENFKRIQPCHQELILKQIEWLNSI